MTLILTALCKNGICVCADKRNIVKRIGGNTIVSDNFRKIYQFNNKPLMIFNHGVNQFHNKYWNEYCLDYEKSDRWQNKSLKLVSEDFKNFIENDVRQQLLSNIQNLTEVSGIRNSAFALCGKDSYNNNFEFYEFYWSPDLKRIYWNDTRLICSGEGFDKYLKDYLININQKYTVEYWGTINTVQAKEELKKLFSIAVDKKKQLHGDEFSDDFDLGILQ